MLTVRLEVAKRDGNEVTVRVTVSNESARPAKFDRRLLVGPNGVAGEAWPVSLEPRAKAETENTVLLNPNCFYGRDRTFTISEPVTFHAYLMKKAGAGMLPKGPSDKKFLQAEAEPLSLKPQK